MILWRDEQIFAEITFPGASNVSVEAINASGTYAGFFNSRDGSVFGQFIGNRDQVQTLDLGRQGYRGADLAGINDSGHFVGSYTIDQFQHYRGYVSRDGGSTLTTLDPLPGFTTSTLADINNAGEMVGVHWDDLGNEIAVYYPPGASMPIDLNSIIDPVPGVTSWTRAKDINNRGQILAEGLTAAGYRYYLLSPVPEPGAIAVVLLAALTRRRRRLAAPLAISEFDPGR